jgi:hypothetical protein
MRVTEIPFSVLRFQYQLVRMPLQLIEDRFVSRLATEAPARLIYERSLGVLDATVGNALGDPRLERRGGALAARSDALARAATLEKTATVAKKQADDQLNVTLEQTAADRAEARDGAQDRVEDARSEAETAKKAADEDAKKHAEAAKQRADAAAEQRKESAEAAKRREQDRIQAEEQKTRAAANAKLDDAQAKRAEANSKRTQANRVEQLADEEKQKRQAARATKA